MIELSPDNRPETPQDARACFESLPIYIQENLHQAGICHEKASDLKKFQNHLETPAHQG